MANEVVNIKKIKEIVSGKVSVNDALTDSYCPNKTDLTDGSIVTYFDGANTGIEINNPISYQINQLVNGSDVVLKENSGPPHPPTPPMWSTTIMEYTTFSDNEKVAAPYKKVTPEMVIDWGDGTIPKVSEDSETHTYLKSGTYLVKIFFVCTVDYMYCKDNTNITNIIAWGDFLDGMGIDMYENFYGCGNLQTVPPDTKGIFSGVTSFNSTFKYCKSLTTINDIFDKCISLKELNSTFYGCTKLTNFYALLNKCPNLTQLLLTFHSCEALTQINSDLFAYCPKINNLVGTFFRCISLNNCRTPLTSDGKELWTDGYIDGGSCFYSCYGLTNYDEIPQMWKSNAIG